MHQPTAARFQEEEGPAIARSIMEKLNVNEKIITEVFDIVGHHHHPRENETLNFKVLYDADLIVNMAENHKEKPFDREKLEGIIQKSFLTLSGQEKARAVLLK